MGPRTTLALVGLFCVTTMFSTVRASCPATTLENQFMSSAAVFVGRATNQQVVPATHNPSERVTETTFEVEDRWKGPSETTVRIQTCGWTLGNESVTCSEGFRFSVGDRYLVFAAGQPLETSACVSTERVDRAERTLQWLSDKPHKKNQRLPD